MVKQPPFPTVVAHGLTRMFRVVQVDLTTFHVEQKIERASDVNDQKATWQTLAISSKQYTPQEAIGVMEEAQMAYALEMKQRREMHNQMLGQQ